MSDLKLDTVIRNATVLTMDDCGSVAATIGVLGEQIVVVDGPTDGYTAHNDIDASGLVVIPGFQDAHCHTGWYGLSQDELDLSEASTLDAVYAGIGRRAAERQPGEWVLAAGFNHFDFGGRYPQLGILDAISPHNPVFIRHNSGHACVVNSAAAQMAGLPRIVSQDGSGDRHVLREKEQQKIQEMFMPYAETALVEAIGRATSQYASEGITSFTEAGIGGGWIGRSPIEFAAYQTARERGQLHARAQIMVALDALHPVQGHASDPHRWGLDLGLRTGVGDDWLSIGPAKVFIDGSLLGLTAAMSKDYCTGPADNHGSFEGDPDEVADRILGAYASGWSIAAHAIGDVAIAFAVELFEKATRLYGKRRVPNRIEHGGVVPERLLARAAAAGVVIVPQPGFIPSFGVEMALALGPERVAESYRARSQLDAGMTLPGSSDRPVAPGAPLRNIQAFVERRCGADAIYGPDERIDVVDALRAYTRGSAEATGCADRRGTITTGKLADLVLLERNPLDVRIEEISSIGVRTTLVGGRITHHNG